MQERLRPRTMRQQKRYIKRKKMYFRKNASMRNIYVLLFTFILLIVNGCGDNIPEPGSELRDFEFAWQAADTFTRTSSKFRRHFRTEIAPGKNKNGFKYDKNKYS